VNTTANYSQMSTGRLLAAYGGDIGFELKKMLRTPAFALPTLLFPAMFYLIFGVLMGSAKGNAQAALYSFAGLATFGTMAPGLFGFGVSLAFEREYGLLVFKQALPMPPGAYLIARMAMAMIFSSIISLLLTALAKFAGHVPFTFLQGLQVYLFGVLGVLPFCAIGLAVGASVSGQAAPAIVNLIYLPMAFFAGLWVPIMYMGHTLQQIAPALPAFHLAQMSLHALGAESFGTVGSHIASLAGFTIVFFMIATAKLASGGVRMFGGANGARTAGFPLQRILARAVFFAGIALIIAGFLGGSVKIPAHDAGGLVGTAAPDIPVIASFDDGTPKASYGVGWMLADDSTRGGNSKSTVQVIAAGANHTKGALEASGTIGDALEYPFGGTIFFPKGTEAGAFMDYSNKHTLSFRTRGDGRHYKVIFLVGTESGGIPPMYEFVAGPEWQDVSIELDTLAGMDIKRVHAILLGSMAPTGDFRFAIDDVRLE
jgi:ABC-2 type transport system permease protein